VSDNESIRESLENAVRQFAQSAVEGARKLKQASVEVVDEARALSVESRRSKSSDRLQAVRPVPIEEPDPVGVTARFDALVPA